ncbi:MAG: Inner membrane protein YqiK [Myxococcota bacterium]|nr:Inner membrane protein YqiK [Myxococcota bacterium]
MDHILLHPVLSALVAQLSEYGEAGKAASDSSGGIGKFSVAVVLTVIALILFFLIFLAKQYKRCPSNRVLVIYGSFTGEKAARCMHGGGAYVWPLVQDYAYLSLEPITIEIDLLGALSKKNIRVNVPATFTVGISTEPSIMNSAAERLLSLNDQQIAAQARDIILGQLRLVIATLSIEEINQDREKFLDQINKNVNFELNKIGLEVINVNIRDITDESGYIEAIGKKAAAEAIQKAKVEVALQEKDGAIGEANANREKEVLVAQQVAQSAMGQKEAERDQRITVARLEAEGVSGEAQSHREQDVAVAEQKAKAEEGKKRAQRDQRVAVAALEADAVKGENTAKAEIAEYNAQLEQRQADAQRTGQVALANSARDVLIAEKEQELARLSKDELARQEIEKKKIEVDAEAEAERLRRIARGEADAVLAKYTAEAEGTRKVLEAKAKGYEELLNVCGDHKELGPTLLIIEKLPELVSEQVKAIQNLKIDKVTVWENGNGDGSGGSTANFLRGLITALPPVHDLARQAGIDLPQVLGTVMDSEGRKSGKNPPPVSKKEA